MTVMREPLADPVENETYQLDTAPSGEGGVRWDLFRYQRSDTSGVDGPLWCHVATHTTAQPPSTHYREAARAWLCSLGHDPDAMDLILILPDGVERVRRAVAPPRPGRPG